jgi:catechol 2,3-dioxygenase-like lactoylglutathione lyase family enzyme
MRLTNGFNHIALITSDLDRLLEFYIDVFDATVIADLEERGLRHSLIDFGGDACLHPFQLEGNPRGFGRPAMFERGHLDHVAINASDESSFETLRQRLIEKGASDGIVTDFGRVCTVSFVDPDGFDAEIALWRNEPVRPFDQRRRYSTPVTEAAFPAVLETAS